MMTQLREIVVASCCMAAALLLAPAAATAQAGFSPPTFQNVPVHDPSVVRNVDGQFYVFGSHLAAAKSRDLLNWQMVANGVTPTNPLFNDVTRELAEALDWAQTNTLWAADVIQLADGKFYMYYNACKGDSPRSAMGVAVADRIEGPYVNKGIFLKSGQWGLPSEDGTIFDARKHPNTVDPHTFFDAKGKLWMVYGSYSGGIFIMAMNPTTGMPLAGQGYGKRLIGGNHSRIEGAYMLYSPATSYYYLFTSFGGLDASGGYNIRVARSTAPDGPFVDAAGTDMASVKANPALPIFDDASIAPHGVKLMGNFRFDLKLGEAGAGTGLGYISPGHNSAYYEASTGKHFIVFHSRFPGRGEEHEVRVHQLLMNADAWPVIAPYRHAKETLAAVRPEFVSGDYLLVNHGKDISAAVKLSQAITLQADGRVSGALSGSWALVGSHQVELNLGGGKPFKGVFLNQWNEAAQAYAMTFSALSADGVAVFGSRLLKRNDAQIVAAVSAALNLGDTSAVTADLLLPTEGTRGASISWASSNPAVLSPGGIVTRPGVGQGNASVTLTATIRRGSGVTTRTFTVLVREQVPGGLLAHYGFNNNLAESTGLAAAGLVVGNRLDVAGGSIGFVPGVAGSAAQFNGASGIRLPNGLIGSRNSYTVSLWLKPDQLSEFTPTFFGARDGNAWISLLPKGHGFVGGATMLWSGTAWYDAGTGMNIPIGAWSHLAFSVHNGAVKVYINGMKRFTGTGFPNIFTNNSGVFALGVNWWDQPYQGAMDELRVYQQALSDAEIAGLALVPLSLAAKTLKTKESQ